MVCPLFYVQEKPWSVPCFAALEKPWSVPYFLSPILLFYPVLLFCYELQDSVEQPGLLMAQSGRLAIKSAGICSS